MANLREQRPRMALLGVGLGAVCIAVFGAGALSATAQSPPKGMSTKQPGAPPQSLEELRKKGFIGVPNPDEEVEDPGKNYPDPVELSKGSLQPPKIPQTPQILRYRIDRPLRYVVRGTNRMAVKGREDLKQVDNRTLQASELVKSDSHSKAPRFQTLQNLRPLSLLRSLA